MEFGLYTFVENTLHPASESKLSPAERLDNLLEEIELADQAGLQVFGIGEHHREEYLASSPSTILAAAATRTSQIRLSSAVTVLGSEDPVRVYQQFSTLDLLSHGRAEIMVGRGSFTESFPLFGFNLHDYDDLFAEKLDLLLKLRENTPVTWSGRHRAALKNQSVYPAPIQSPLPVWVAVGGTPQSAYRTGYLGLPMALAIIGGMPEQFAQITDLHKRGAQEAGHGVLPLSINSHGFIAKRSQDAANIAFPAFKTTMDRIGKERGWPPMSREQFEGSRTLRGANFVGSPQEIVEKILFQHEIFRHQRFLMQMSVGSVPHSEMLRSIELFATEVVPAVNKALKS